jgi:glycosyltransferase involved in cell wall biosynthesis
MKILLEPQIFNNQIFGGISRYYTEIFNYLIKNKSADVEIPIFYTDNLHLIEKKLIEKKINFFEKFFIKNNIFKRKLIRRLKRKNLNHTQKKIHDNDFDLLVPTYYNPYFLKNIQKKPFVLTVYDMIHEIFPECFDQNDQTTEWKKVLIPKASRIIAVSENTKRDILKFFPKINPDKIQVIYHGYSKINGDKKPINLPKKYILYVGNREHYKNFIFFAKAIKEILDNDKDLFVFCAGGTPFYMEEIKLFKEMNLEDRFLYYRFKDNELAEIYKNAECFVFPSQYEGFGIPVLEAMANSCPVILANHSSFPEVAGNAGIFFDLNNSKDLCEKINITIYNKNFRNEMIFKGLQNVKRFLWEDAAKQCFNVYQLANKNE